MITPDRMREMEDLFWSESIDPETEEWRDYLTAEEAAVVADWDDRVNSSLVRLFDDMTAADR